MSSRLRGEKSGSRRYGMKKIEAIIQPGKFNEVTAALEEAGYPGLTVTEVQGHGKQKGLTQNWLGRKIKIPKIPKMKLEIVLPDPEAEKIMKAILQAARTGQTGDGKIFVHRVEQAYRIRDGAQGDEVV
jgi:nitrogen regulatory protein P-II 1